MFKIMKIFIPSIFLKSFHLNTGDVSEEKNKIRTTILFVHHKSNVNFTFLYDGQ